MDNERGKALHKCMPLASFAMILVSALPLFVAIMKALDTMFIGAAGEVFAIIFSAFFCCVWCCVFTVSSAEVDKEYYDGQDEEERP